MKKTFRKAANLLISLVVSITMLFPGIQPSTVSAQAQAQNNLRRDRNAETGKVTLISGADNQPISVLGPSALNMTPEAQSLALVQRFASEFGLTDPSKELKLSEIDQPSVERVVSKYQQVYQDVPVMAGELMVNATKAGELISMNGEVSQGLALDTKPELTVEAAIEAAKQGMVKWYGGEAKDYTSTQSSLWIFDETLLRSSIRPANLVWRVEMVSAKEGAPIRELVLVDAKTGNVTLHFNQVDTAWSANESGEANVTRSKSSINQSAQNRVIRNNTSSSNVESVALAGTTWYVATTGNDANSCSSLSTPCATIQQALTLASNGDVIRVAEGIYTSTTVDEGIWVKKDVNIFGGWDANTFTTQVGYSTIDGQDKHPALLIDHSRLVEIENFIITNGYNYNNFYSGIWYGGGINNNGTLQLKNTILRNNSSQTYGGGINNNGSLTLINSSIINNHSYMSGGGIYNYNGSVIIANSTISGNNANNTGGGISMDGGSMAINFTTISLNHAPAGGGIIQYSGTVQLQNTILAGNVVTDNGPDCSGVISSNGHNIIKDMTGCTISLLGSDQNTDPQLGLFVGSQGYHPIYPSSPAIDAGDSTCAGTVDRRNLSRPQGTACDIGSYEYTENIGSPASILAIQGDGQQVPPGTPFPQQLKAIVFDNNGSPITGVQVMFTAPSSGASGTFADTNSNTTIRITDADGVATAPSFIANSEAGEYTLNASATGLAISAEFKLSNGVWYVSTTGNDANDCLSPSTPCATIDGAIRRAFYGDMIYVAAGNYQEYGARILINERITILGGWDATFTHQTGFSTLDGGGYNYYLIQIYHNSTLERLILRNAAGGIYITSVNGCVSPLAVSLRQISITSMTAYPAITNNCGTLTVINGVVSSNHGGSITNNYNATTNIQNSTITNNFGDPNFNSVGGIRNDSGSVTIQNSIVNGNVGQGNPVDCWGAITSNDHNIIGSLLWCNLIPQANDQIGVDPKLGPLSSNGYIPLQSTSPAIDSGDLTSCPPTDQRGVSRPQGSACDIGAYEYSTPGPAALLEIAGGARQPAELLHPFLLPLAVYVFDAYGSPVNNANVTFIAPESGASGTFADSAARTTTVVSDDNGLATSSIFTANNQVGTYDVVVSVPDFGATVSIPIFNITSFFVSPTGNDSNTCIYVAAPCLTINGAIGKAASGNSIKVSTGTYNGVGNEVVLINKGITLSGGWDEGFTTQNGMSIIDGQGARRGITISGNSVFVDHFLIQYGFVSGQGGGISNTGNLTLSKSIINGNESTSWGSGIYNQGVMEINESTISENITCSPHSYNCTGSGIGNWPDSTGRGGILTLNNSLVALNNSNNTTELVIGIYSGGMLSLNNSTVSENGNNSNFGVGIGNVGKLFLNNSTITGHHRYGLENQRGDVILKNTIIARNSEYGDCYNDSGSITSQGYNLIGIGPCGVTTTEGDIVGTTSNPVDPQLAPLQDNGGSTLTHALMTGSPAIAAGNPATPGSGGNACLVTDQRGVARPVGARCDIGAYEGSVPWTPAPRVHTYTAGSYHVLPGSFLCNQTQPNCTNGSNPHADAAHKYAIGTYNFYAMKHLRDSLDNKGILIISSVHYCAPYLTCPYANAFWNGTQMAYGGAYGFPLADDVVAHELTHGVTDYESNLFYFYQSGAINESFSDVWGEYYDQTNGLGTDTPAVKWLMGEDVSGSTPIRSMSNPPAYGDPDKMTSANYDKTDLDNGGVHTNSGVNNKAVFLMVDGGIFNSKTVTAIGWDKTAAIYYEAQTNLLSSGADYSDLYYAVQQACINLTGELGITAANCLQVKNALDAVQMYSQPAGGFNPDAPLCAAGAYPNTPFFQDNMESGTSKWTLTGNWSLQNGYASSPAHMLYGDDSFASSDSSAAMTTGVTIPAGSTVYLHFKHAFAFEYYQNEYYDGAVLEYTINNGATWVDASSKFVDGRSYSGLVMNYSGTTNALKGRAGFVGDSHGYVSSRYNLSSLTGQTVRFRWRFATDNMYSYLGWMVDDVRIYTCGTTPPPPPPAPTVASSARANVDPNSATSVNFTVTFSQPVTGVDAGDFSLTTSGVLGAAVSGVSGSGSIYTVTVSAGSGSGMIQLNIVDNDSIRNGYLNPLGGAGTGNGDFTSGENYTIRKTWIFGDVPNTYWSHSYIERLYNAGITGGCSVVPLSYCPATPVTRAQMAIFLLRGMHGNIYTPPAATGTKFTDVPLGTFGAAWIEQLAVEGITSGCGGGNYCPTTPVSRAQMAIFLVRAKHGIAFTPPTATGLFTDVPVGSFGADYIEQLSADAITSGCGGGNFCPNTTVKRDSMAVFLVKTFNLP